MQYVFPDYYKKFKCINSRCRHNCCIGWEIDIDPETADFYSTVEGTLGSRLRSNISADDSPHFVLGQNERCPFLNSSNLCDIITELGQEHLCVICAEHPRFHNELPGRTESGLGLCCEEACRIILGQKEPAVLVVSGESECDDPIIALRDQAIAILQNRDLSIQQRTSELLEYFHSPMPEKTAAEWVDFLLSLERLDDEWTRMLELLSNNHAQADYKSFDRHMADRQSEYEQLMVYIIYRHFANAPSEEYIPERVRLAVFAFELLRAAGAVIFTSTGSFSFEQQAELARLFSSEIEYSDENLDILLEELAAMDMDI